MLGTMIEQSFLPKPHVKSVLKHPSSISKINLLKLKNDHEKSVQKIPNPPNNI